MEKNVQFLSITFLMFILFSYFTTIIFESKKEAEKLILQLMFYHIQIFDCHSLILKNDAFLLKFILSYNFSLHYFWKTQLVLDVDDFQRLHVLAIPASYYQMKTEMYLSSCAEELNYEILLLIFWSHIVVH